MNGQFTTDGRLRGSYVYMLLCQMDGAIHIKIGRSSNPFARLNDLRVACPVIPEILAVAEVINVRKAARIETALHAALDRWHTHLEWFRVLPAEREEFNAAWRPAVAPFNHPSRPFVWRKYSVPELIKDGRRRRAARRANFARRGKGFQNFMKDSAKSE